MGTLQATSTAPAPPFAQRQLAARDSIVNYLALLKNWNETRFAVAGNGSGVVNVPDSINRIYARLDSASGPVAEARVTLLAPAHGDTVLLRREQPGWLGGWLLVDWFGPGTPPLETCVALIYILYDSSDLYTVDELIVGAGIGTSHPNWKTSYSANFTEETISAAQSGRLILTAIDNGSVEGDRALFYSANGAATWAQTHTVAYAPLSKPRFDLQSRQVGWAARAAPFTTAEKESFFTRYVGFGGPTSYSWASILPYINNNFLAGAGLMQYSVSTNDGAAWATYPLEKFGELFPTVSLPPWSAAGSLGSGDTIDDFIANINPCGPGGPYDGKCHLWVVLAFGAGSHTAYYIFCCSSVPLHTVAGFIFVPGVTGGDIAPLYDGEHCYLIYAILYRQQTSDVLNSPPDFLGSNLIYKVDNAGNFSRITLAVSDFGLGAADSISLGTTDPLDIDRIYVIAGANQTFGVVSFSGITFTALTTPWSAFDYITEIEVSPVGTIFVPVLTGSAFLVYISRDGGSTWSNVDFSAYANDPTDAEPRLAMNKDGLIAVTVDSGKVIYSTDDGLTWDATGAILLPDTYILDIEVG